MATWQIYKGKAFQLQTEIEEALPTEARVKAIARSQNCTLEELVAMLLAVMQQKPIEL